MSVEDTLKEMAVRSWGCPESQVDHLWQQHVQYCDSNGIESYGGMLWRSLVDKAKREGFVPVVPTAAASRAQRSAEEARRRALEADGYAKAAEPFPAFLARMRAAKAKGENVGAHIDRLIARSDELDGSVSLVEIMGGIGQVPGRWRNVVERKA